MSVLVLALLALPGGLATTLLASQRSRSYAVGLATAIACAVAAVSISAADVVPLAGSLVGGSDGLRTLIVAWASSILLFGLIDALLGLGAGVLGPSLIGLSFGAVGLAVPDPGIGFALLGAGALVMGIVPMVGQPPASAGPGLAIGTVRPLIASAILSLLVVAWGASAAGPLGATSPVGQIDPALERAMGLATLGLVAAVVIRLGAIPAHVWAAKFAEAMPASAVPPLLGWGAAAFVLVAFGWVDVTIAPTGAPLGTERAVMALVGVASIILGGVAAVLHDDIEHVLAYAIVQDAGIAVLAFAATGPAAATAGRDWILASVAVKAGLAAWVHVTRATFGSNRRTDLRGWARRAPILGLAFALVAIGAIGLPTFSGFEARATLIQLTIPGPLSALILVAAFAPVVFLGRLLVDGFGPSTTVVRSAIGVAPVYSPMGTAAWAAGMTPARIVPSVIRANRLPLSAAAAVLAAVVGLSVAIGGLGSTTGGGASGGNLPGPSSAATGAPGPSSSGGSGAP